MIKPMKQLTQSVILKRKRKDFCGGTRRIRGDHPCRIEWKLLLYIDQFGFVFERRSDWSGARYI